MLNLKTNPASILYKSTAGRYRPVSYPDGPITARYRFIKNAYREQKFINKLQIEAESLRNQLDDLEQYGRRQSIRLYNVSHEGCVDSEEAALKVFNVTMKLIFFIFLLET